VNARLCWSMLALSICAGCADDNPEYVGLSFDVQSAPPVPVSVESDRIELIAGLAVKVGVEPISSGRDYHDDDLLVLRSDDSDVLAVYAGEDAREFVLVGLREGETCLHVKLNRVERECIEVQILPAEE
jgi:hypothetical protein